MSGISPSWLFAAGNILGLGTGLLVAHFFSAETNAANALLLAGTAATALLVGIYLSLKYYHNRNKSIRPPNWVPIVTAACMTSGCGIAVVAFFAISRVLHASSLVP